MSTVLTVPPIFFQPQLVPCVGSTNSVHSEFSETTGTMNRMKNNTHTLSICLLKKILIFFQLLIIIDNISVSGGH